VFSWMGLVAGLVIGVRLLPFLTDHFSGRDHLRALVMTMAVIVVSVGIGQALGLWIGERVGPSKPKGSVARFDRAFGGLAGLVGVIALAWLVLPLASATPGWVSQTISASVIARVLSDRLPEPPDMTSALRSLVGSDNFPQVFEAMQPTSDVVAPPEASGLTDATARTTAKSVVKVEGVACKRIQDGTGWVVGDGLVITNAHVVAGESNTEVERDDGRRLPATIIGFDPKGDLALLRVNRLDRVPLVMKSSIRGTTGGVFGHPGGAPLRIAPFEVARRIDATGRDIYGLASSQREVLELASALRPGDSGSALVDQQGEVVGVAFAISTQDSRVSYALTTSQVSAFLASTGDQPVSTGTCIG